MDAASSEAAALPAAPRPSKIALLADWYLPRCGGLELHLCDLAERLRRRGHAVHVITATPGPHVWAGIPVHRLAVARAPRYGFACTPSVAWRVREVIERGGFDLVHAHGSIIGPTAFGGAYVAQRMGVPTVLTFHSVMQHLEPALYLVDALCGLSRWRVAFSCVSEAVAD